MQHSNQGNAHIPSDVHDLLQRVPSFQGSRDIDIAPLQGVVSLNNTNYRVRVDGTDYVLRYAVETAHWLGVRRAEEQAAAMTAAQAGIGPQILYSEPVGHMLMPFIAGRHWQPHEFLEPSNILRIADTLKRLHAVKEVPAEGSVFQRIERLLDSAKSLNLEMPPNLSVYLGRMRDIKAMREADTRFTPGLCHNDFWSNNFLDDGQQLWLVDWEFAGMGDGLFDIATISIGSKYSEEQQAFLLRSYGYTQDADLTTLQSMKYIVRLFEALWALVQHGLRGSNAFDYLSYARSTFQTLEDQK